jgi:hypothetical protein
MEAGREALRLGPLRFKTVCGEPYDIGGRKFVPVVRIISLGRARATIGTKGISGRGAGLVWIRPLALVEETPDGERRIDIVNETAAAVRGRLGIALGLALLFAAIRWWARWRRRARSRG